MGLAHHPLVQILLTANGIYQTSNKSTYIDFLNLLKTVFPLKLFYPILVSGVARRYKSYQQLSCEGTAARLAHQGTSDLGDLCSL